MSFPRYPNYKDSGVEWLGEVPGHWEASRLRYICQCLDGQRIPLNASQRSDKLGDIPYWGANSIVSYVDEALFDEDLVLLGEDGAPFFEPSKPVAFFSQGKVWPNNHVHVLRPTVRGTGTFIAYVLNVTDYAQFIDGSTRDKLTQGSMNDIPVPWPPIAEQTQIAAFLDRETAKIDELVAEQRHLMELLKEKRQAVISHAVTQGLNPGARMKPSGIEWLREVPEHWRLVPLRWSAKCCSGDGLSSAEVESIGDDEHTVRVIGGNGLMGYTDQKNVDHSVLAIGRVGALCGNVHLVHPPAWITDNALVLDPVSSIFDLQFLSMTLRSRNLNDIASKTAQPLITGTQVSDQRIPCPPLAEQKAIAEHLTKETAKLDTLTTEAQRAIDLLQERRTALISAAVTGQIDVRNSIAAGDEAGGKMLRSKNHELS